MTFPSNPNNNDIHQAFGRRLRYKQATGTWEVVSSPITQTIAEALPTTAPVAQAVNLPMTGNEIGSMAYVQESNRLYVWNGSGWFEVALVNTNPTITAGGSATYELATDGTPTVVTLTANDPEGIPLTWSYSVTSGALGGTTVSNVDNVFTVTPGVTDTTFTLTFTASDGVNVDTSTSSFTLAFGPQSSYQGSVAGYRMGGYTTSPAAAITSRIDKFLFATDTSISTNGTMNSVAQNQAGHSSSTHGYTTGGNSPVSNGLRIEKHPFASTGGSVLPSQFVTRISAHAGHSSSVSAYASAGTQTGSPPQLGIFKVPFATDVVSSQLGTIGLHDDHPAGLSSNEYGITLGGRTSPTVDTIDKFSFSSDGNATAIGSLGLNPALTNTTGISGPDYGYAAGGFVSGAAIQSIQRMNYTSDVTTTANPISLATATRGMSGVSSETRGYVLGGYGTTFLSTTQRFPFASDVNGNNTGNLSAPTMTGASTQD